MCVCLSVCLSIITGSSKLNECAQPVPRWVHAKYGGVGHQPFWRREEAAAKETSQTSASLCNGRRREESKKVAQAWRDHARMCTNACKVRTSNYVILHTTTRHHFMVMLGTIVKLISCLYSHCLPRLLFKIVVIKTISQCLIKKGDVLFDCA